MLDGNTEPDTMNQIYVGCIFPYCLNDKGSTFSCFNLVKNVNIIQIFDIISAPTPCQSRKIGSIADTKIVEGAEEFPLNGFRQANFRRRVRSRIRTSATRR